MGSFEGGTSPSQQGTSVTRFQFESPTQLESLVAFVDMNVSPQVFASPDLVDFGVVGHDEEIKSTEIRLNAQSVELRVTRVGVEGAEAIVRSDPTKNSVTFTPKLNALGPFAGSVNIHYQLGNKDSDQIITIPFRGERFAEYIAVPSRIVINGSNSLQVQRKIRIRSRDGHAFRLDAVQTDSPGIVVRGCF